MLLEDHLKLLLMIHYHIAGIDLTYSSDSPAGVGTGGIVDVVVGQGSSVISLQLLTQEVVMVMMKF